MKKKEKAHKTVKRWKRHAVNYCDEPRCKLYGKPASQGVCHTLAPLSDSRMWEIQEKLERRMGETLTFIKKHSKGQRDYVRALESYFVTYEMNNFLILDEVIRLRRDIALLRSRGMG